MNEIKKLENKKIILFDLDDTLFDFGKGETFAISFILDLYDVPVTVENVETYKQINVKYWEKLERKEMTKDEILENRFKDFFALKKKEVDAKLVNKQFLDYLSHEAYFMDDCLEVLSYLKNKGYLIYLVSNGIKYVQEGRLSVRKEILDYIDRFYLSDNIGYTKPDPGFIDYIINETHDNKEDMVIIGDSLTSDMKLGFNTGIDTIWLNNKHRDINVACKDTQKPTMMIYKLKELFNIF